MLAIHTWSPCAAGPFAVVSCQLNVDALEAELFGIPPSLSSSGEDHRGKAAFCDGGTLVLEEIGQAPPRLQAKLLRLIQDKEYERAEEMLARKSDVRIVATSSIDLREAVNKGTFLNDLLMALDVVQIPVPALRSRPLDIPMLAERYMAFFDRQNHKHIVGFSADAMYALKQYSWTGNVRELRNVVERAVLLCNSDKSASNISLQSAEYFTRVFRRGPRPA